MGATCGGEVSRCNGGANSTSAIQDHSSAGHARFLSLRRPHGPDMGSSAHCAPDTVVPHGHLVRLLRREARDVRGGS